MISFPFQFCGFEFSANDSKSFSQFLFYFLNFHLKPKFPNVLLASVKIHQYIYIYQLGRGRKLKDEAKGENKPRKQKKGRRKKKKKQQQQEKEEEEEEEVHDEDRRLVSERKEARSSILMKIEDSF